MKLRLAMILALSVCGSLLAQSQPDDQTRQIYLQEFLKARPAGAKKPAAKPASAKSTPSKAGIAQLGLTLWKLQPAQGTEGARLLVQESSTEFTAAPVDPDTKLSVGDRVRLSIESPRAEFYEAAKPAPVPAAAGLEKAEEKTGEKAKAS